MSEKIVARLCRCCEGSLFSIVLVFTQLHRLGFDLEFEAFDLWQRQGKMKGCFKKITSVDLQKCQSFSAFLKMVNSVVY